MKFTLDVVKSMNKEEFAQEFASKKVRVWDGELNMWWREKGKGATLDEDEAFVWEASAALDHALRITRPGQGIVFETVTTPTVSLENAPIENIYADFVMREGATLGALHAALNALKTVDDLKAATGDEIEELDAARDIINRVHGYIHARCEYRRVQMHRIKKNMEEDHGPAKS